MRALVLAWALLFSATSYAVIEVREFDDPEKQQLYEELVDELRCLVCQNQNLADSNAPLAADLRQLTYDMIREGKSDAEVIDFMVARYGDFVLYRPPLKPSTAFLWGGPFLLLALGSWLLLRQLRRRASVSVESESLSPQDRERLQRMLKTEDSRSEHGPDG